MAGARRPTPPAAVACGAMRIAELPPLAAAPWGQGPAAPPRRPVQARSSGLGSSGLGSSGLGSSGLGSLQPSSPGLSSSGLSSSGLSSSGLQARLQRAPGRSGGAAHRTLASASADRRQPPPCAVAGGSLWLRAGLRSTRTPWLSSVASQAPPSCLRDPGRRCGGGRAHRLDGQPARRLGLGVCARDRPARSADPPGPATRARSPPDRPGVSGGPLRRRR